MDTPQVPSLADTMEAERARITKVLEGIEEKRLALDQEERSARIELAGIQAYLDAKMGKVLIPQGEVIKQRAAKKEPGTRGPRQTGLKDRILAVMTVEPISKQDILAKLEAGDNKAMQQAVSNSLVALKKDNKIISRDRGMYSLPQAEQAPPPAEPPAPPTPKRVKKEEAPTGK